MAGYNVKAPNCAAAAFAEMPSSAVADGLSICCCRSRRSQRSSLCLRKLGRFRSGKRTVMRLPRIYACCGHETGHDFSEYKDQTFRRRRQTPHAGDPDDKARRLRRAAADGSGEVSALFRDLVIGVTSFSALRWPWRTRAWCTDAVQGTRKPTKKNSVWVTGGSTGEESLSIAIFCASTWIGCSAPG